MTTKTRTIEQKTRTLKQFVRLYPSQHQAAEAIGVATETLNRWINGRMEPHGLSRRVLRQFGVRVDAMGRIVIG